MMTLPQELDDAARIDGCSEPGIFARIVVPLSKPAITTVTLFELIFTWNNFIGPLIYLRDTETFTLSVGIQMFFTQHGAEWGLLMAASTMFTLPMVVLFFFAQRTFIEGISTTGIKG
jgi:multiple sugar transport system permease protein